MWHCVWLFLCVLGFSQKKIVDFLGVKLDSEDDDKDKGSSSQGNKMCWNSNMFDIETFFYSSAFIFCCYFLILLMIVYVNTWSGYLSCHFSIELQSIVCLFVKGMYVGWIWFQGFIYHCCTKLYMRKIIVYRGLAHELYLCILCILVACSFGFIRHMNEYMQWSFGICSDLLWMAACTSGVRA